MIKLRYAIIGTLIPVLIIVNYASGVIDDLYDELRILKNNGYCECYELQEFDVTVTLCLSLRILSGV
jgi:hypothetical protein